MLKFEYLRYHDNFSDRQVVERAKSDLAFRYFPRVDAHDRLPDPSSLCLFRGRLGQGGFRKVFRQVISFAREQGLVRREEAAQGADIEAISIDGIGFNGPPPRDLEDLEDLAINVFTPAPRERQTKIFTPHVFSRQSSRDLRRLGSLGGYLPHPAR